MRTYLKILEELGWPKVYLVPPKQYEAIEGDSVYQRDPDGTIYFASSAVNAPVLTLRHGLRGKKLSNSIYHELQHQVWGWRRHWWIECAAEVLAGGGGRGWYSKKYNHTIDDVPARDEIIRRFRKAVVKFNQRSK